MDVTATVHADVDPEAVFEVVSDLSTYPSWLDIVPRVVATESSPDNHAPAWIVDLRGQIGPLRRSKRLRMVRVTSDSPTLVIFERDELGERRHSRWVLQAKISEADSGDGVNLEMSLHYGGSMWVPMLDRVLGDEIRRSRGRLLDVLDERR